MARPVTVKATVEDQDEAVGRLRSAFQPGNVVEMAHKAWSVLA